MSSGPRIGIIDLSMGGWAAGAVVTRTMALALQGSGADVVFFTNQKDSAPSGIPAYSAPPAVYLPGEWTLRKLSGKKEKNLIPALAKKHGVDVLLPVVGSRRMDGVDSIGWIPDFQHLHLSDLYTEEQRSIFNKEFGELAARSKRMLFSSNDSRGDFVKNYPEYAAKAKVASFPSLFAFESPEGSATTARGKYHLPEKFLLVINQFWRHKNHRVVVESLAILRKRGLSITTVMVGLPADHRDKQNGVLSEMFQSAVTNEVWNQCLVLGKVSREDIVSLLRTATAVIQPSRFEGWNTTIQDAKTLGCPFFVSDLPVHREQCPNALGFFPPENADALADVIAASWNDLPSRPNPVQEATALAQEKEFALAYGRQLVEICSDLS
ncbi:MAG: glycosyltransferase [Chthoniobacterales bacterium]